MIEAAITELAPELGIAEACRLLGAPRSSYYRRQRQDVASATDSGSEQAAMALPAPGDRAEVTLSAPPPCSPRALSSEERAHVKAVLVPEPLMHRRRRVRRQHLLDAVVVGMDDRPGRAAVTGVDQLGEPALRQLSPLGPGQRWPTRRQPGRHRRSHVLADRAPVHTQAGGHHRLPPAGMPVLQNLNDVSHFERSPCHQGLSHHWGDEEALQVQGARRVDPHTPSQGAGNRERPTAG